MYCTCIHVHTWAIHAYTYTHGLYMHTRVCMYCSPCVYVYATVYVYACTVHACTVHAYTCMHVWPMCVRVCMYSTCIYVYGCVLHVSTCMHVRYIRKILKWYGNGKKFSPHTNRQNTLTGVLLGLRAAKVDKGGQECGGKGGLMPPPP